MNPTLNLLERYAPITPVKGAPLVLAHQSLDIFALWQAWEAECETVRSVPYWALVWPAAQVLSQYIFKNPSLVKGQSVLDCGCGGGVTAIAAAVNGALSVTGCDLDQAAVDVAKRNAAANQVAIAIKCQDVIECCNSRNYDLILVADLFYEKEFSKRLMVVLQEASKQGTVIVIADSGRPFLSKENLKEIYTQSAETSFDVEGCLSRTVRLYRL